MTEILLLLDKYVKKLITKKLITLLIFGPFFSKTSLTELSTDVKNDNDLQKILKLESISKEIFNFTYKQVMSGDTELLNSTELDPIIL